MRLHTAGENALILYVGEETSPEVSAQVQAAAKAIARDLGPDLIDLVPSYASLLIIYDPLRTDHLAVRNLINAAIDDLGSTEEDVGNTVVLPAYYAAESGEDLEALAQRAVVRDVGSR